jgi:hypothetical protein
MKIYLVVFCTMFSCKAKVNHPLNVSVQNKVVVNPINYDSCKKEVLKTKSFLKNNRAIKDSTIGNIFTKCVIEKIIPAWIGTRWDFYGTSQIPQQGAIACGYFVTTVLRDADFSIQRIKLAQAASEVMIKKLVNEKYIHRFSNLPLQHFLANVKSQGYGLYIIGLDNHTGFIYNDGVSIYFIHSTFVGTKNVQWELADKSIVLVASKYKVIGKISADAVAMRKWINN